MLLALMRASALVALLGVCLLPDTATAAEGDTRPARPAQAPAPSAAALGWFGVSVGGSLVQVKTQVDGGPFTEEAEGSGDGGGTYSLFYEKQLWRWVGVRGLMRRSGWQTDLSEYSGDGDRVLYDLGGALVLSLAPGRGRGVSFYGFAPISFSWSSAPTRAPREVIAESMDVGTGYRVGGGLGILLRFAGGPLGMLFELEGGRQFVDHVRQFRRVDGSDSQLTVPISYDLDWAVFTVGLAFYP